MNLERFSHSVLMLFTDERTGLKYELVSDYYLLVGDDEPHTHIGIWGQRHHESLRINDRATLSGLQISGKLYERLVDIDCQAEEMFSQLVNHLANLEGVTEKLKAEDQMEWVGRTNSIYNRVRELVFSEINELAKQW